MFERKHPVAHPTPHRHPRVAGQHLEPGTILGIGFSTTSFSFTSWVQADDDAREAAALRLKHLNMAHRARLAGAGSRL